MKKKIVIGVVALLIIIQFIRPARNNSDQASPNEIGLHYKVSDTVQAILKHSCYDCHSNKTNYPFYVNIQPVGWWLQWHINDGKRHLNFSEFGSYSEKRKKEKFKDIEDAATEGWMPLDSYTWMHQGTKLSPAQAKAVAEWAGSLK